MASSSTNPYPNYPYPSEFNVSDLVPDKLSKSNYSEWKPLMLDFIESRGMNEFIIDIEDFNDPKKDIEDPYFDDYKERSWRKSDGLVRTWILSTLNKDIVKQVLPHKTAREVWMALETMFGSRKAEQPDSSRIEAEAKAARKLHSYMPLHIAAIQGLSNLALGRTALHEAAEVGNLEAAKMSVTENPNLPYEEDDNGQTPLLYAAKTGKREMVRFLLDYVETERVPPTLLYHLANSGLYGIALELLQKNSAYTSESKDTETCPLMAMSQKRSSFRSGTPLNSFHKFIYSIAPAKLRNNATKNPAEHCEGNTENSANRENPDENLQRPIDTENLANTENPVENLQSHTENPANRENSNHESPQNLPQNLVVNENSHNDAVNPFVDENQQNLPAITDTENSVVDENPQNVAVNPIVNQNRQNPLAIADNSMVNENLRNPPAVTDTENSVVAEDPQNVAVNPVVNENRQNPLAITDNSIVNENLQNAAVNPVVNENQQNPPAATDTKNSVVDENPQYGAVTENPPIIENNLQNPVNIADSENPQNCTITENLTVTENTIVNENPQIINENSQNLIVTDNSIVNENPQILFDITEDSVVNENLQNLTVYETPHNDIDNPQNPVNKSRDSDPQYGGTPSTPHLHAGGWQLMKRKKGAVYDKWLEEDLDTPVRCPTHFRINANDNLVKISHRWNLVVDGIGRWHAIHWHLADQFVPAIKHIREIKLKHDEALELVKCLCKEIAKLDFSTANWMFTIALAQATSSGIHEIVEEILRSYPAAISLKMENNQSIFQSAIVWRHANVFNLIYQLKECSHMFLSVPDRFGNNALHLAGCLGPQQHLSVRVSAAGAALQMQRELQWFKEVEKFVLPQDKECRNDDGMTPAEVFTKTHKELVEAGERWMKDTATSCTIVAALIATVMFAAAITVPGGNNASSGVSIFSKQKAFLIFGLSDALALFASIASLLMFLSILTARYAEEDFLFTLPKRLICGLVYLFLSISSTMTAFGAAVYLMMGENRPWIIYPIVAFAYIPVHLFVSLLFPLLRVMYKSTHRPAIFGKQSDHMFF